MNTAVPSTRRRPAAPAQDLRHRVLDASRTLLEEVGVGGLSMREVARRAGVTHQAPYHHFADRSAILAELVVVGFDELAQRLAAPLDAGGSPGDVARATGEGYVGFAVDNPGLFKLMFRPELLGGVQSTSVREAGERAYAQLQRLVGLVHGRRSDEPVLSGLYWSVVHGLAGLLVDGPLGQVLPESTARRLYARTLLARFTEAMLGLEVTRDPGGGPREGPAAASDEVTTR